MLRRVLVVAALSWLFAVLPGCFALHRLARAQAESHEGKPIPCGPEARTLRDFSELALRCNMRTMVDAYGEVGKRSPAWDRAATKFLSDCARCFAETPDAPDERALLGQANALLASGCDDPLVLYCCGVSLQAAERMEEAEKVLEQALQQLPKSGYGPMRAAFAAMRMAEVLQKHARAQGDLPEVYWDRAIKWVGDTARQGTYEEEEERVFLSALRACWYEMPLEQRRALSSTVARSASRYPYLQAVVRGLMEIDEAWEARGDDWASEVTPEGWKGFEEHLTNAREVLTGAWGLHPECPEAPALMVKVTMAGHAGPDETGRLWFDRAVAAQMDYLPAYYNLLWFMRPRWGGSHKEMYEFGVECLETDRFDTDAPFWFFRALQMITEDLEGDQTYWRMPETREHLQTMFAGYAEKAPAGKRAWFRSVQAAAEWYMGDYQEARRLLGELSGDLRESVFRDCFQASAADALGETYLLSGSHREKAQAAAALRKQGSIAEALAAYEGILAAGPENAISREYVGKQIASLRWKLKLAAGEWVKLKPDAEFTGWIRDRGSWTVEKEGAILGVSTGVGLWLLCDEDVGSRIEFRGEMEMLASRKEDPPNCGVVFNYTGTEDCDYFAWLVSEQEQKTLLSHDFREEECVYTDAEVHGRNTFLVRLWDNSVTTYLNGKVVDKAVKLAKGRVRGRAAVGVGSKCQNPGTVVRFRNLQVRRLSQKPGGETVSAEDRRDAGSRS